MRRREEPQRSEHEDENRLAYRAYQDAIAAILREEDAFQLALEAAIDLAQSKIA